MPEREAVHVLPGMPVRLETGRGVIDGEVIRIDPTASERSISIDVALLSEGRPVLRPDQTISGRIELERLDDVVHIPRPTGVRDENQRYQLFIRNGNRGQRVAVEIGRLSSTRAEVLNGLSPGDTLILADMQDYLDYEHIRIN